MSIPAKPTLTTPPTAPVRGEDRASFATKANNYVVFIGTNVTDLTAAIDWQNTVFTAVESEANDASASASTATTKSDTAVAAASAAVVTANAALWVSGASYSVNANAISGIDFGTYRAITTHTGVATDPSADPTNWILISAPAKASQAEAEAGTDNTKFLTPLRTAQAIAELAQSFEVGDTLTSARNLSAPEWLPSDGGIYLQSSYPDLFGELGIIGGFDEVTKLSNPATLPTGNGNGTSFSPDGIYLSVAHDSSPFIAIYKRSGDTFTKLSNPATLPTGTGNGTAFSTDGTYLSVAHTTSPFITIYKRSGDVFTKLDNPATLPTSTGRGAGFSPDGTYLSVAHSSSPFVTIYKRSGDVFTKLSNPATLQTNEGRGTGFSPDGTYLSVAHFESPFIAIYKRSGDTFTKLSNPATLPTGTGNGTAFSTDGTYLSVAHNTSPFVTIYSASGYDTDTQFKLTTSPAVDLPLKTFIKAT